MQGQRETVVYQIRLCEIDTSDPGEPPRMVTFYDIDFAIGSRVHENNFGLRGMVREELQQLHHEVSVALGLQS